MRSRLSLYMNSLTLDEILYLGDELDRRKEKHRRDWTLLSVQTDRPVLRTEHGPELARFARDMRHYISAGAAVGGGTLLAYTPETSVLLFNNIPAASRTCSALLGGLAEFNARFSTPALRVGLKLGLASGVDTLAPGSQRCIRDSALIRRANQAAWRGAANTLLMDENSYHEWPDKFSVVLVPFDIDGHHVYRVMPGLLGAETGKYDNEALLRFLRQVADAGIPTLKYDIAHLNRDHRLTPQGGPDSVRLHLEAYDPVAGRNLTFKETIAAADFADRVEVIRRMLSSLGLAMVRHELSADSGV